MQWSGTKNAGFSEAEPWFVVNPNYPEVNVEREEEDPDSILNFYRKCLALRKSSRTLLSGAYREYAPWNGKFYMYERYTRDERVLVVCSFSDRECGISFPKGFDPRKAELVLCNYQDPKALAVFRPYEVRVFRQR